MKKPLLTKERIMYWLYSFKSGDIDDMGYRRRVIDTLVNSVYVYDEGDKGRRIIFAFNISGQNTATLSCSDIACIAPPWRVDKKDVNPFFLVFMRVCGLLGAKSEKRFYRRCPNSKPQQNPPKRSFHLIFQAGNSAFLRLPLFFPVVGTVKVFGRYIDRLTKAPNGPISSPQNTRG